MKNAIAIVLSTTLWLGGNQSVFAQGGMGVQPPLPVEVTNRPQDAPSTHVNDIVHAHFFIISGALNTSTSEFLGVNAFTGPTLLEAYSITIKNFDPTCATLSMRLRSFSNSSKATRSKWRSFSRSANSSPPCTGAASTFPPITMIQLRWGRRRHEHQ